MAADDIDQAVQSVGRLPISRGQSANTVKGTVQYTVTVYHKDFSIVHAHIPLSERL
jgi:hypothetical protein